MQPGELGSAAPLTDLVSSGISSTSDDEHRGIESLAIRAFTSAYILWDFPGRISEPGRVVVAVLVVIHVRVKGGRVNAQPPSTRWRIRSGPDVQSRVIVFKVSELATEPEGHECGSGGADGLAEGGVDPRVRHRFTCQRQLPNVGQCVGQQVPHETLRRIALNFDAKAIRLVLFELDTAVEHQFGA